MNSRQVEENVDHQLQKIIEEVRAEQRVPRMPRSVSRAVAHTEAPHTSRQVPNGTSGRRPVLLAAGAVLLALLLALTFYTYTYGNIHYGLRAGDISIGGLTQTEAAQVIIQKGAQQIADQSVELSIHGKTYPIAIQGVTSGLDGVSTARAAYDYTHKGAFFTRLGHTVTAVIGCHRIPLTMSINQQALAVQLNQIAAKALTQPTQPSWKVNGDTMTIDRGKSGIQFDQQTVKSEVTQRIRTLNFAQYKVKVQTREPNAIDMTAIKKAADSAPKNATVSKSDGKTILPAVAGVVVDAAAAQKKIAAEGSRQTYQIPVTRTAAAVDAAALSKVLFRDVLSTSTTQYHTSKTDRVTNVRLAASSINGVILNPGEIFSYNGQVGQRTAERGFRAAGAYSNGQLVDELGGGVCQPSSTLYMAVLRSGLHVVERHNHSHVSSYTPLGEDATVSYGSLDFRFQNDTNYPVKILSSASGGAMSVTLVGTNATGRKITTDRKVLATYEPTTVEEMDNTLPAGTRTVKQSAETGYKVQVYQVITENGTTRRVIANTSTYRRQNRVVLVGTGASGGD